MCGGCFVQQSFFYRPTEALISMCSKLRLFSRNSQRKSLSASWGLICPSLSFAMPLPIPLKALTLEPPPVASSIRNQIFLKDRLLAPEAEPLQIPYFLNLQSPSQPYQTLLAYPRYRSLQAKLRSDQLLLMTLKHPSTQFWFQKTNPFYCHLASHYSSHSFHIGIATKDIRPSVRPKKKKPLPAFDPGTRTSEVFETYIWSDRFHIKEAH